MNKVAIIMGSDSDLTVMAEAETILKDFAIDYEITVVSAHRTPERLFQYAHAAKTRGFSLIIAGAGGAAHLPGMVASITPLPVIGVPIKTSSLNGLDSLLSIVQMPGGIPVATTAINGAKNAGLLAVRILALNNPGLAAKLDEFITRQEAEVLDKAERLEDLGGQAYLAAQKAPEKS